MIRTVAADPATPAALSALTVCHITTQRQDELSLIEARELIGKCAYLDAPRTAIFLLVMRFEPLSYWQCASSLLATRFELCTASSYGGGLLFPCSHGPVSICSATFKLGAVEQCPI